MANSIDNAIARLQDIAIQCTIPNAGPSSTTLKAAPDYPIEDASALPISIAHLDSGDTNVDNASTARILPMIAVDFHFSRISMKNAYTQIDAVAQEFSQRLAGDPTLNGTISTIIFPVHWRVVPSQWDKITTQALIFNILVKLLANPTVST